MSDLSSKTNCDQNHTGQL